MMSVEKIISITNSLQALTLALLFTGFMLPGRAAWATPTGNLSPADKYEIGVECVGYYDFGLSMMPISAPNRADVQTLRDQWRDYVKTTKSTPDHVVRMDVSKAQQKVQTVAMSGDRKKFGTYMTAINSRCEMLPLDPSTPSPSNPFGFEKNSDMKTYVAAMQCAGKYIPEGGPTGKTTMGFQNMAKTAKPNINDKTFKADLSTATMKSMNILIKTDLQEFAALEAQCKAALPFLK